MKTIIIILLLALLTTPCHDISAGNIIDKEVHPSYTGVILIPVSTGKTIVLMSIPVFYPECYSVKLKGVDKKGRIKIERFYIHKSKFDSLKIGDYQCFTDGCTTRPYVRK